MLSQNHITPTVVSQIHVGTIQTFCDVVFIYLQRSTAEYTLTPQEIHLKPVCPSLNPFQYCFTTAEALLQVSVKILVNYSLSSSLKPPREFSVNVYLTLSKWIISWTLNNETVHLF